MVVVVGHGHGDRRSEIGDRSEIGQALAVGRHGYCCVWAVGSISTGSGQLPAAGRSAPPSARPPALSVGVGGRWGYGYRYGGSHSQLAARSQSRGRGRRGAIAVSSRATRPRQSKAGATEQTRTRTCAACSVVQHAARSTQHAAHDATSNIDSAN
jgi:hypothetical protein